MDAIKISLLTEKSKVNGDEMIPIQIGDLNYRVSVDTLIDRSREILHAYQQYTYDELKQLKDSKLLLPGEHYLLTDYQCIYKQPVSEELITCDYDGWMIMLLATSEDTFSNDAHVLFTEDSSYIAKGGKPIIECKYMFDNFSEYTWSDSTSKGVIIDLTDSNNNRCNYDFKHIKFRRWALKDVTENDTVGAVNQPAAYRCYGTADEPKRSDGRSWVGSGLEIEKEWIHSIFAGTFNSVMWKQSALHEDYINKVHKPFKRTDENILYVAYNTTLDSISQLTFSKPGLAKFEIDSKDYIDCYTFEQNGIDISNDDKVRHNHIYFQNKNLPNTVIIYSSEIVLPSNIFMNKICATRCTFALHDLDTYKSGFYRNNINYAMDCIFNVMRLYDVTCTKYIGRTYISGSLYDCTFEDLADSVLFGCFAAVEFKNCTYNLLFGNEMRIIKADGTWDSTADGNYWYNDIAQEWFGYNIMAPFQYSVFYPHTNTNTVVMPYNKGVTLMGTIQDNCIERMCWGTILEYGSLQGNYTGELTRCVVSPLAFASLVAHSSGTSNVYKLEGAVKLPSITNTDIKCYADSVPQLVANMTDTQKTKLAETGNRKILCKYNGTPVIKYYGEIIL